MKKNFKKVFITCIVIVIATVLLIGGVLVVKKIMEDRKLFQEEIGTDGENKQVEEYIQTLEDGTKLNNSNKLNEKKVIQGFEIENIQLTYKNGMTVLLGTVTNATNQDRGLTVIEITLVDNKNNKIDSVEGLISPTKAGGTVQLNIGVSSDYANAYDFKVEIK